MRPLALPDHPWVPLNFNSDTVRLKGGGLHNAPTVGIDECVWGVLDDHGGWYLFHEKARMVKHQHMYRPCTTYNADTWMLIQAFLCPLLGEINARF